MIVGGRRGFDGETHTAPPFPIAGALVLVVHGRTRLVLAVQRAHLSQRMERTTLVLGLPSGSNLLLCRGFIISLNIV